MNSIVTLSLPLKFIALAAVMSLCLANAAQATEPNLIPYTVQKGDTMIGLGERMLKHPEGWRALAELNRLKNPHLIRIGQTLMVPSDAVLAKSQRATVEHRSGSVEVLDANRATTNQTANIEEGQYLRTGKSSSAVLRLADGSQMRVLPESTVQLTTSRNYLKDKSSEPTADNWFAGVVRVLSGALEAKVTKSEARAAKTRVETPTAVVGVRGTEFRVRYEAAGQSAQGNSAVEVTEGLVLAENSAQRTNADLSQGYGAVVDPNRKEVSPVKLLPAIPSQQLPQSIVRKYGSTEAIWRLPQVNGAAGYHVQAYKDASYQTLDYETRSTSTQVDLSPLADGNWHMNVRALDASGLAGYDSKQSVRIETAPKPTPTPTPVPTATSTPTPTATPVPVYWSQNVSQSSALEWRGNYNAGKLTFTLRGLETPDNTIVSVAEAADMSSATQYATTSNSVQIDNLYDGTRYYLQFSGSNTDGLVRKSRVYKVDIPYGWGQQVVYIQQVLR